MRAFTDTQGRNWEVTIDVAAIKRVRGLLKIDLYDAITDGAQVLSTILRDPCCLVDVLYVLCQPQANERGISDMDFGRGFAGDSLEKATEVFVEELIDFFPDPRGRKNLRILIEKGRHLGERLHERADKTVASWNPDAIDLDSVVAMLNGSSGASPANSASPPAPSPSPSSS